MDGFRKDISLTSFMKKSMCESPFRDVLDTFYANGVSVFSFKADKGFTLMLVYGK